MARMKKNPASDDNKFDVKRLTSTNENTSKGKLNASGKKAAESFNKASKKSK